MVHREDRLLQERIDRLEQVDMSTKKPSSFAESRALVAAIAEADTVTVWEGLPHPMWEKHLLEMELLHKKTIEVHGFPFYQDPLEISVEDAKQLIALFRGPDLFKKPMVGKLCGGFHPDYRLVFRAGANTYEVLICLTCHEASFFGPSADSSCDIEEPAYQRFQRFLKRFVKNRPTPSQTSL